MVSIWEAATTHRRVGGSDTGHVGNSPSCSTNSRRRGKGDTVIAVTEMTIGPLCTTPAAATALAVMYRTVDALSLQQYIDSLNLCTI